MSICQRLVFAAAAGLFAAGFFALAYLLKNPFWVVLPSDYDWQAGARYWIQLSEAGFLLGFCLALAALPSRAKKNSSAR